MNVRSIVLAASMLVALGAMAQPRIFSPLKPLWLDNAGQLRQYICSEEFAAIVRAGHDQHAVDSIFAHAMFIAGNNVAEALLAATVACFDHSKIQVRLGVATLTLPLSVEDDSIYNCARSHFPTKLFFDTPPEGDADKLQHFFGSAYLQYVTNSSPATGLIGRGIEWLEPTFIVGGVNDPRDLRADKAGQAFAILFGNHYYVAPSVVLEQTR